MIAKVIALSLIPAGAAALGVVGYMQHQRRAFTTETQVAPHVAAARPAAKEPAASLPATEPELVLKPLVVKPPQAKPHAPKALKKAAVPCSGWRALGYEHVENGKASGVRQVRELCDPNAPPAPPPHQR